MNKWLACIALATSFGATGCPSITVDEDEVGPDGPTVEFDPSNKVIPFPNNLLLDPATGKVNLPASCNPNGGTESATQTALRTGVLNTLDGFGTFKTTLNVTFTEAADLASLTDHVFVYKVTENPGDSEPLPVTFIAGQTARFDADCENPAAVEQVTIVPLVPLDQSSTYVVGITEGVTTADGTPFLPSFVRALVRSAEQPVVFDDDGNVVSDRTPLDPTDPDDLATLQGIDLLWNAHKEPLLFLAAKGQPHASLLLGWSFNTQTVTDPLDASIATSPAGVAQSTAALAGTIRLSVALGINLPNGVNGQQSLQALLPANSCQGAGGILPCQAVGEIVVSGLIAKQYQIDTANAFDATKPIPGPWADPLSPPEVKNEAIQVFLSTAVNCPVAGCPTVVFGHGLGSSKSSMFAIAAQLGALGFNVAAIDFVAHGGRAKQVSNDPAIGCNGSPTAPNQPQCFAPFLSPNLAGTRDNVRQSIVDIHSLIASLKACGIAGCNPSTTGAGPVTIDPLHIVYAGISLGGIMGSAAVATSDSVNAAALNVPGVGWVDILENTQTLAIRCSLVDGLIDAGILTGDKFNRTTVTGLCVGEEWKLQPGYRQFAVIGRWILDPADPVNFTSKLAAKRILIQRVMDDAVVPNIATDTEGALVGLTAAAADCGFLTGQVILPSAAISTNPQTNKFVNYTNIAPGGAAPCAAGNSFAHASLLAPTGRCVTTTTTICDPRGAVNANGCPNSEVCNAAADGSFGTGRLQSDALTFLSANK